MTALHVTRLLLTKRPEILMAIITAVVLSVAGCATPGLRMAGGSDSRLDLDMLDAKLDRAKEKAVEAAVVRIEGQLDDRLKDKVERLLAERGTNLQDFTAAVTDRAVSAAQGQVEARIGDYLRDKGIDPESYSAELAAFATQIEQAKAEAVKEATTAATGEVNRLISAKSAISIALGWATPIGAGTGVGAWLLGGLLAKRRRRRRAKHSTPDRDEDES